MNPAHPGAQAGWRDDCVFRADRGVGRSQRIVTATGADAIPLAITTRVLAPVGVVFETVKWVDEATPGAIETDVQLLVRA